MTHNEDRVRPSLLLLIALLCGFGCGPSDAAVSDDIADAGVDTQVACDQLRLWPDGQCCPVGQFYHHAEEQCSDFGPRECAATLLGAPESCAPRWCGAWQLADGKGCKSGQVGCTFSSRACTADELAAGAGCEAGSVPSAGSGASNSCERLGGDGHEPTPVQPLPPLAETRMCADKGGSVRPCEPEESGCGPGQMPAPEGANGCMSVGVPWLCPPGFLPVEGATAMGCKPDPSSCGSSKWPEVAGPGALRFVDAAASAGGNGSEKAPYRTISAAISAAPAGATVAIAAGTYKEELRIKKALNLIGRCAAMVVVDGTGHKLTVGVFPSFGSGEVKIGGLTITGDAAGLQVQGSLPLSLHDVFLDDPLGPALSAVSPGTVLHVQRLLLQGSRVVLGGSGLGMAWVGGATGTLRQTRITGAHSTALMVNEPGSFVEAEGVRIEDTLPSIKQDKGEGIYIGEGARVELYSARISSSHTVGIAVSGVNTRLTARGVIVDGTRSQAVTGKFGVGLYASTGAQVELHGLRFQGNRSTGVRVSGQGTTLLAHGMIVDGTLPREVDMARGHGLLVDQGGRATLTHARLSYNRHSGLTADGKSVIFASDLLVDHTLPSGTTDFGIGIWLQAGASVTLVRVRASKNASMGIGVASAGTTLSASAVLVDGPAAKVQPKLSPGVLVGEGAKAVFVGGRVTSTWAFGMAAGGASSSMEIVGMLVERTFRQVDTLSFGVGAVVSGGANMAITSSLLRKNHSVAVACDKSKLSVTGSLLVDTGGATYTRMDEQGVVQEAELADGLLANGCAALTVNRSAAIGQARAGFLLNNVAGAKLTHNYATGGVFGLATQGDTDVHDGGNLMLGTLQNTAGDQGLLVPQPPAL